MLQLQEHLDWLVASVERLQPGKPPEMLIAAQAAAEAVERKKARANGAAQRAGFLELTGHLDTELVDEAAAVGGSRQRLLAEQAGRQEAILRRLEEVAAERHHDFDNLVTSERRTPGSIPAEAWAPLLPSGEGAQCKRAASAEGGVSEEILRVGNARIEAMIAEFTKKFLPGNHSNRAADVEEELEVWRLQARQDLLEELCSSSESFHKQSLQRLRANMEHGRETPYEQLSTAVSAAEDFRTSRNAYFSKQLARAEDALSRHSENSMAAHASRRRRAEWCALRRLGEVREGIKSVASEAEVVCLLQIGQAAQWLVKECHGALPMFEGGFERPGPPTSKLATAWGRSCAPSGEGLGCVERAAAALPDSAEACAILKALLCLVDEEMDRVTGLLSSIAAAGSVKLGVDGEVHQPGLEV